MQFECSQANGCVAERVTVGLIPEWAQSAGEQTPSGERNGRGESRAKKSKANANQRRATLGGMAECLGMERKHERVALVRSLPGKPCEP